MSVRAGHSLLAFTHYRHGHLHENREPKIQEGLDALMETLMETRRRAGNRRVTGRVVDLS